MASYPIVVRNNVPDVQRGFMLLWVGIVATVTWSALRTGLPDSTKWWPFILLFFWGCGLFALRWAFTVEAGQLCIEAPRHARIRRGRPFARRDETLQRLDLAVLDTKDGEGDPYFHLVVATPEGPLIVSESHRRPTLEALKSRLDHAWLPRAS